MSPSNRRSPDTFRAFGSYVPKVTAKCFERHGFHLVEIILNWPAIVGRSLARHTVPYRLRWPRRAEVAEDADETERRRPQKTSLEVWVADGRALDVQYSSAAILDRINRYFGYRAVTELRVLQGSLPPVEEPVPIRATTAAPALERAVDAEVPDIADEALRKALVRLGASVRARRNAGGGSSAAG